MVAKNYQVVLNHTNLLLKLFNKQIFNKFNKYFNN